MADEFGSAYARTVAAQHQVSSLAATADDLLAAGTSPRRVWEAICDDFDVPPERRHGVESPKPHAG